MNKRSNPFYQPPQTSYAPPAPQPPLPPGQAPAQHPGYADASAYWAAASAAAQSQYAASAAAQASYANYGYGQSVAWQSHPRPPPPPAQPHPAPVTQYPYQPAPVVYPSAPQSYPPGYPAPPTQPPPASQPRPVPSPARSQNPSGPASYHSAAPQPPPAKRGRFDGSRGGPPGRPGFRNPNQTFGNASNAPNATSSTQAPSQTSTGGSDNTGAYNRNARGGRGGRGGLSSRGGLQRRGPNAMNGRHDGSSRGGLSRGPRRGSVPGNRSRPFEAPQSHNGWGRGPVGGPPAPASSVAGSNTEREGKRTLTDFRIVGFGFSIPDEDIVWSWGTTRPIDGKKMFSSVESVTAADDAAAGTDKPKKLSKETARIRIYFQPPPGASGVIRRLPPMPPPELPARQSAKRKKSDSDDEAEHTSAKRRHPDGPRSESLNISIATSDDTKVEPESPTVVVSESKPQTFETSGNDENTVDVVHEDKSDASHDWLVEALAQDSPNEEHDLDHVDEDYGELQVYEEEGQDGDSLFGSVHPSPPGSNGPALIVHKLEDPAESKHAATVQEMTDRIAETHVGDREIPAIGIKTESDANDSKEQAAVTGGSTLQGPQSGAGGPGTGNKLSISYAASSRRLVLEASIVDYLKVYRAEGRIEFVCQVKTSEDGSGLDGVFLDVYDASSQTFQAISLPPSSAAREADATLPPLNITAQRTVSFHVFLDMENPLSVPRWVKTGDADDWLLSTFGAGYREFAKQERGWQGKISVADPDPAPTITTIFENWATNSMVAQQKDREQFLRQVMGDDKNKDHNVENIVEILLRLVRSRDEGGGSGHHWTSQGTGALLTAAAPGSSPFASQQTPASLAVLALFRLLEDFGTRLGGDDGKKEAHEKTKAIIRSIPQYLLNKSLDGMFREWFNDNKRSHR